ncbi:glycosyltransferase family 2 protein [uncultured Psychroserpens sp.]|uniref:glycosyltransferase family 2 protein n=1 Tax=uncultured Psychroserpens sp. TaxID=255436 RepID=UPI0026254068|nr:glycosyltransferase family 2 protein [uncultured Psychroserpens sp.]
MKTFDVSIIISTYNKPNWLQKVLWSYNQQTINDFEVVIADDGSTEETRALINDMKTKMSYPIIHVWQEDNGFQKTKILNKATVASRGDYLIYTDGDCLARADFIETHLAHRSKGCALSSGYFKLTNKVSNLIGLEEINSQQCFDKSWLLSHGQPNSFKMNKLTRSKFKAALLNFITPTKATFDGMNASAWKVDILTVNGFDERMQYGGEDRELGERLMNYGIKFKQIRYSAICLHLFHERAYVTSDMIKKNDAIRKTTKQNKVIKTPFGIESVKTV